MNYTIKKIRTKELATFVESRSFQNFEFVPISPIRAKSYLANPNSNADDVVLYLGFIGKQLVAFRSLYADCISNGTTSVRFAWCSGAWVHPDFRKKGFSKQLLHEAYKDWDKKLMLSNYTPASEKLIIKKGWFKVIHQFEGARAYLFPKTKKLISKASANFIFKTIFTIIDLFISAYSSILLLFYKHENLSSIKFTTLEFPDEECYSTLEKKNTVFSRDEKELRWIFDYPWISQNKSKKLGNYPFSSYSNSFCYKTVKLYSENIFVGFFIFSVRDGHLKTLYFNIPDEFIPETALFLKSFCKKHKIEVLTIYKKALAAELFKRKFPFLHLKKYGQKIYSTFDVKNKTTSEFQDGTGDTIFT